MSLPHLPYIFDTKKNEIMNAINTRLKKTEESEKEKPKKKKPLNNLFAMLQGKENQMTMGISDLSN